MVKKLLLTLMAVLSLSATVWAQNRQVSGTVTGVDGTPIAGATVMVDGTANGTTTEANGRFTVVAPANGTLTVSFVGYETISVAIAGKTNLVIELMEDVQSLDDVVVVGYGTMAKKDVTSSIAKVSGEDLALSASSTFDQQLAGRAAGVLVTTPSGTLGETPIYRVRGMSTISSSSQPLMVIDGVPMVSGDTGMLYAGLSSTAEINPADIESVEILKDGAATAIYGSRAANGVVLITTKRGKKGTAQVTYDGYVALASPYKTFSLLNADQFAEVTNEMLFNTYGREMNYAINDGTNTNWNDYIYNRNAVQHSHTLSVNGGSDKSQYYFSLGYTDQEGIIRSNMLERISMKGSADSQVSKWLKVGMNVQASRSKTNGFINGDNSTGGVGFAGIRMLPNVSVYNPDDPTGYNLDPTNRKSLGRGSNAVTISNGVTNIVWLLDNNVNKLEAWRTLGNAYAELTLYKGLTFRSQGGLDVTNQKDFMFWHPDSGDGYGYRGLIEDVRTTFLNWNWQNVLSYNGSFNKHNISATAVQEYTYDEYEYVDASYTGLSDVFFSSHVTSGTFDTATQEVGGTRTFSGLASYMLRANYNYDSKYYFGVSVRWDGLSRLSKENRWGTFWGLSGAWRLSGEDFWKQSRAGEILTDLRIRASYATVGNSELSSRFPYLNTYSASIYGGQSGIKWNLFGNDQLKWETTETYDVGIDGNFLHGRVNFEFAYWKKNSKDLVMRVPTDPTQGVPGNSYYDNVGRVSNSGIELTIGADVIRTKDFTWHADFNFSTLKNRVEKLYDGQDIEYDYTIVREGESYASIYGYDYYGVNKANGNPIWRKADGRLIQLDQEQVGWYSLYHPDDEANVWDEVDEGLEASDKKILGSALPKWYGGFDNTFYYKGFDLNIFFRFSGGNHIMDATTQVDLLNTDFANKGTVAYGRWQSPENPGDGMTPKLYYGYDSYLFNREEADSHFVSRGDYLKLQTLALGYTFPKKWTSKLGLQKVRLYVQCQNLWTITGYKGLDPETYNYGVGVDWGGMPQQRTFTFGANLTF